MGNGILIHANEPPVGVSMHSDYGTIWENITKKFGPIAIVEFALTTNQNIPAGQAIVTMDNNICPVSGGKIISLCVNGTVGGYAFTVQNTSSIYASIPIPSGASVVCWGVIELQ